VKRDTCKDARRVFSGALNNDNSTFKEFKSTAKLTPVHFCMPLSSGPRMSGYRPGCLRTPSLASHSGFEPLFALDAPYFLTVVLVLFRAFMRNKL
jgi:hypothetical protein